MKRLKIMIPLFLSAFLFTSCFGSKKETVREIVREIPTISDVPKITKETKKNVQGLRSLSENYVIKNVKKANKLLSDTKKELEKAEKKDQKKKALKIFVSDYKEVVDFYRSITKDKDVSKIKDELMGYYRETIEFYESLEEIEKSLGYDLENYSTKLTNYGETSSREEKLKKKTLEQQVRYTDQQKKMINEFKNHYGKLIPEIEKVQKDVDYFVLTLQETAIVYETAYKTAELSMNIANAIDNISELNALGDLTNEIMDSWKNLDSILDNLTEISNLAG